ncbi:MAG TPA: glycosyltransferase family 39 protein [Tepidisphaeraceae bacterium]|jgi:uncharacterized membrane protein
MIDTPQAPRHLSFTRRQLSLLALILIAGAFIRFYQISRPSLWLDEIWSIEMARGQGSQHDQFVDGVIRTEQPDITSLSTAAPWWKIWSHLQLVIHPPLYFIVLRWWMDFFGNTAAATRSLSAIVSLLGIAVFYDVCRLLNGPRIALIATALMAVTLAQIEIAQEARSYPQLICLGLCCCDALVRIELFGANIRRLSLLSISLIAFMLTHYFAIGAVAAISIYALLRLRGKTRNNVIAAIAIAGLFAAAVWGPQFLEQMRTFPDFNPGYLRENRSDHLLHTLWRTVKLPLQFFLGETFGQEVRFPIHIVAAIIILYAISRLRARPDLLLWVLWIVCIIGWSAAQDLAHHSRILDYLRYTILASPGIYALIAAIEFPRLGRFRIALPCAAIAILAVVTGVKLRDGLPAHMDCRSFSRFIDSHAKPDDLLLFYYPSRFASPGIWYMCFKYYSPDSHRPWLTLRKPPDAQLLAQLEKYQSLWVIGLYANTYAPQILPGWQVEQSFSNDTGGAFQMRYIPTPAVH